VQAGPFRLFEMIPIIIVFFISGLCLNTSDMMKALRSWPGVLYGLVAILGITPCLGFAMRALPLDPPEFAAGLAIFCTAPTTLGVGAALVRQSGGNDTLATMMMTATSLLSVFTIPLWLKAILGGSATSSDGTSYSLSIDIGSMLWRLAVTVLAPALVGKALREFVPPVQRFAKRFKEPLGMLAVACLAFIVWQTLSGAQALLLQQQFVDILYVIIAGVVQHLVYLAFNIAAVVLVFKMRIEEGIAVVVMSSQKSAPVAVTVITFITSDIGTQGLLSLPCIVGQLAQIFMGAAYAPFVKKRVVKVQARRKAAEAAAALTDVVVEDNAGVADAAVEGGKDAPAVKLSPQPAAAAAPPPA
jgi:sodium/bile acid cotransporter 7